jgi:hypothetical protein
MDCLLKYPNITLEHVKAHTNLQDIHSIGNDHADRLSKQGALKKRIRMNDNTF